MQLKFYKKQKFNKKIIYEIKKFYEFGETITIILYK